MQRMPAVILETGDVTVCVYSFSRFKVIQANVLVALSKVSVRFSFLFYVHVSKVRPVTFLRVINR
jgi:hypothetical protein